MTPRLEASHFIEMYYVKHEYRLSLIDSYPMETELNRIDKLSTSLNYTSYCKTLFTGFIWKIKLKQS